MVLGMKNDDVKIVQHCEDWEAEFNKAKEDILINTNLSRKCIEHIGSTSVKDIKAKPIIDILIGVNDISIINKEFFSQLEKINFYKLQVNKKDEIVCAKFLDNSYIIKTHIIHVVNFESEKWNDLILFRDILRNNKEIKVEYENLKQSFLDNNLNGIKEYTKYKEKFVSSVLLKFKE